MKSGMHDQCYFLFLGAEVHHHRSAVPVRSTRALPGPHHHCSRHLPLKENLDIAVLVARLLIRVGFRSPKCFLCFTALNEHLVDYSGGALGGSRRAPLRGFWPPSVVASSAGCRMHLRDAGLKTYPPFGLY